MIKRELLLLLTILISSKIINCQSSSKESRSQEEEKEPIEYPHYVDLGSYINCIKVPYKKPKENGQKYESKLEITIYIRNIFHGIAKPEFQYIKKKMILNKEHSCLYTYEVRFYHFKNKENEEKRIKSIYKKCKETEFIPYFHVEEEDWYKEQNVTFSNLTCSSLENKFVNTVDCDYNFNEEKIVYDENKGIGFIFLQMGKMKEDSDLKNNYLTDKRLYDEAQTYFLNNFKTEGKHHYRKEFNIYGDELEQRAAQVSYQLTWKDIKINFRKRKENNDENYLRDQQNFEKLTNMKETYDYQKEVERRKQKVFDKLFTNEL